MKHTKGSPKFFSLHNELLVPPTEDQDLRPLFHFMFSRACFQEELALEMLSEEKLFFLYGTPNTKANGHLLGWEWETSSSKTRVQEVTKFKGETWLFWKLS